LSQDQGDDEPRKPAVADDEAAWAEATPAGPDEMLAASLEPPPETGAAGQLERRALLAEARVGEVLTAYRKLKVENEGFRERVTRDVRRQFERHNEKLLLKFIEILDNLDRALEAAEQSYAGNPFIEGLILVRTQLLQILQREGLERIPVLGLPYDPTFSEAVGTQAVSDPDHEHIVVRELLRGYRLHGRVARASRVMIGVYSQGAARSTALGELIGADEVLAAGGDRAGIDPAAETLQLDEATLRQIFGPDDSEPE
jgi:molecular chaperone GrpE